MSNSRMASSCRNVPNGRSASGVASGRVTKSGTTCGWARARAELTGDGTQLGRLVLVDDLQRRVQHQLALSPEDRRFSGSVGTVTWSTFRQTSSGRPSPATTYVNSTQRKVISAIAA